MPLVGYLGSTVVATWLDPELAGYRRDYLGLQQLLRAVEAGEINMIACEALDRLARDAEDVAWLGKKLAYHGVPLHTREGRPCRRDQIRGGPVCLVRSC